MKDFMEVEVWRRAYALNRWVYALVRTHPALARNGLAPQMQRSSTAIAANIAEGCGAYENNGGRWYFNAALGAMSSLEYLMLLAFDLRLIPDARTDWFIEMSFDIREGLRGLLEEKKTTDSRSPASLTMVQ
jgi:four helix bundle protein